MQQLFVLPLGSAVGEVGRGELGKWAACRQEPDRKLLPSQSADLELKFGVTGVQRRRPLAWDSWLAGNFHGDGPWRPGMIWITVIQTWAIGYSDLSKDNQTQVSSDSGVIRKWFRHE